MKTCCTALLKSAKGARSVTKVTAMRVTGQNLKDLIEIFFIFLRTFIKVHTWFVMASAPGPVGGKISRCWRRQGYSGDTKCAFIAGTPSLVFSIFF